MGMASWGCLGRVRELPVGCGGAPRGCSGVLGGVTPRLSPPREVMGSAKLSVRGTQGTCVSAANA